MKIFISKRWFVREVKAQIIEWASRHYYKQVCYNSLDSQSEQPPIDGLATEIGDVVLEKSADAAASVF